MRSASSLLKGIHSLILKSLSEGRGLLRLPGKEVLLSTICALLLYLARQAGDPALSHCPARASGHPTPELSTCPANVGRYTRFLHSPAALLQSAGANGHCALLKPASVFSFCVFHALLKPWSPGSCGLGSCILNSHRTITIREMVLENRQTETQSQSSYEKSLFPHPGASS